MRIVNEFEVAAPVERVWDQLLDVEAIAPCAPGAQLTEVVDERNWKGKVDVKLGPITMSYSGTVMLQDRDDQGRRAVLRAEGREQRGRGAATALVSSTLEAVEGGTKVRVETDLTITGTAAQYGRGMIGDVTQRLIDEFARCLQATLDAASISEAPVQPNLHTSALPGPGESAAETETAVAETPASGPVKGMRLGIWALLRAIVRFWRRVLGS